MDLAVMCEGGKFACFLAIAHADDTIHGDVYANYTTARERDGFCHVYLLSGFCF
jgi:hypothetical protein